MRWRSWLAAVVLMLSVAGSPARAEDSATVWSGAGWGTLAVLSNVFYMPAKVTYAVLGAFTGGMAYCLTGGDLDTAETIWVTSVGGNYIVTPRMLQGEEAIAFSGSRTRETAPSTPDSSGSGSSLSEQNLGGN